MSDDRPVRRRTPSRRETIKYGGAVIGGGLLAGCSGGSGDAGTATPTATESGTDGTEAATSTSYEACIEPVGCQTFESVPETYIVNNGEWADMAFALGQRDGFLTAANMIPSFLFEPFGLDVPPESQATSLSTTDWDKERFYELDPDVILMDPNYMHRTGWDDSWEKADTDEIRENVAPFFWEQYSSPPGVARLHALLAV